VFESMSQWTWVAVAWAQVLLAYGGYLAYLGWRRRRLLEDDRAQRLLQAEASRVDGGRP
jgi:hypothetical protein